MSAVLYRSSEAVAQRADEVRQVLTEETCWPPAVPSALLIEENQ